MSHVDGSPETNILWRATRIVVPWIGLIVVVTVAWTLLSDYRAAIRGAEATATVEPTATVAVPGDPYVRVLSDGLNLRAEPSTTAAIVRVLDQGLELAFVEESTGWYHVRDTDGTEGWVAAGGTYTELVTP